MVDPGDAGPSRVPGVCATAAHATDEIDPPVTESGGVGAVVAGSVYAYVVSPGNSGLTKCANWEFRRNYPAPFFPGQVRAAKCI